MRWLVTGLLLLSPCFVHAKDTYVVVIDASGSMEERDILVKNGYMTRMEVAKEALKRVLPNLTGDVDLGILVFSAGNLENDWVYPIGRVVREQVEKAIDLPTPYAGTPLGDYIKKGADQLLTKRAKAGNSGLYRLILVTDGQSNEGHDPSEWLADVKKKGIQVDLIGLAMTAEHDLAQQVQSLPTPGTYQSAMDMDQLVTAVSNSTREAPVTATGAIDSLVFDEISPLPDKVAEAIIKVISYYDNTLVGERGEILTVDAAGNVVATPDTSPSPSGIWVVILVLAMLVAVVVIVVGVTRSMV